MNGGFSSPNGGFSSPNGGFSSPKMMETMTILEDSIGKDESGWVISNHHSPKKNTTRFDTGTSPIPSIRLIR